MKKTTNILLLLATTTLLTLASCGGQKKPTTESKPSESESQPTTESESQPTTESESTPTTGTVDINFWHTFGKTPEDAIKSKAEEFQKLVLQNEGVTVNIKFTYKGAYDDMTGLVTKAFATGDNPTIAVAYPDHVAEYFAAESEPGEYVVDLLPYAEDSKIGFGKEAYLGDNEEMDDFVESFIEEGLHYKYEGLYSLPYMKSTEVMFYNMDQLRIALPLYDSDIRSDTEIKNFMDNLSWETFMDLCEVINDNKDSLINTLETPASYDSDGNLIISKMFQNEIGFSSLDNNGNGRLDFNGIASEGFTPDEEQISNYNKTLNLIKSLKADFDKGLYTTRGVTGVYGSNDFTLQKTLFSVGSSGGAGYNFPSTATFEVGICKVPYSNNNPLYVSQGPTLCVLNTNKDNNDAMVKYAWKFLKYITNDEVNASLCVNGSEGYTPVRLSAYSTTTFTSFLRNGENYAKVAEVVLNDVDGRYFNTAVFPGSATLRKQIAGALADVLNNKTTPEVALANAISNTVQKM